MAKKKIQRKIISGKAAHPSKSNAFNSAMPLVSVIIPCLNEEKRIRGCVSSLKAQTYKNIEIIVADGNSEDATRSIAKSLGARVIIEKKRSAAAERQAGSKIANGKILAFLDADTIAPKWWVETLVRRLNEPNTVAVYGNLKPIDGQISETLFTEYLSPLWFAACAALHIPAGAGANLAVKTDAFWKVKGYDPSYITCEDIDLQRKLLKLGKVVYDNDAFVNADMRRVRKWGALRFVLFHVKNLFDFYVFNKPSKMYAEVR